MAMGNKYFDTSLDLYRFKILIQKEYTIILIYDGHLKWQPKCHHKVFGHDLSLCVRVRACFRESEQV